LAWNQRNKKGWEAPGDWDQHLSAPNRPAVAVSGFESRAGFAWLGTQWQREVRLPDETQWQRTAWGEDGRKYPRGDEEPDPERASFSDDRFHPCVGRPTLLGIYPEGNGPCGQQKQFSIPVTTCPAHRARPKNGSDRGFARSDLIR